MHELTCATTLEARRATRIKTIAGIFAATLLLAGCGGPKVQGNGNPSKQGPAQDVHLIWKQATNEWKVKLNNGSEVKPADALTTLAKGTGPTMFVVDIAGNSATFSDVEPLTVWTGDKGQPKQGIEGTQILGPILTKGGKLVFYDLNQGDPVTLNYSLHFNNGVPSVDPIINNGGGNAS